MATRAKSAREPKSASKQDNCHLSPHGRGPTGGRRNVCSLHLSLRTADAENSTLTAYLLFDENLSWYLDRNIQTFTSDPKGVNKLEFAPVDDEGNFSGVGSGFTVSN